MTTKEKPKCKAEWCDREAYVKGYCTKHYSQFRKHGRIFTEEEVYAIRHKQNKNGRCSVDGCYNKPIAKGLCNRHYQQMKKHGRILTDEECIQRKRDGGKKNRIMDPICTVDGCDKPAVCKGYCRTHYGQWYRCGHIQTEEEQLENYKAAMAKIAAEYVDAGCKVYGCEGKHYGDGFCHKHYQDAFRIRRYWNSKKRAIDYLGGKCAICGLKTVYYSVYDFHHVDPSKKENKVADLLKGKWEAAKKELDKCVLLCSNCHRFVHHEDVAINLVREL